MSKWTDEQAADATRAGRGRVMRLFVIFVVLAAINCGWIVLTHHRESVAYTRGYAAAVDSVQAGNGRWGYILWRGGARVRITPGVIDSLWIAPEDFEASAVGWARAKEAR